MTQVPELMAAGVNVAFGHDCVMDAWYPLGSGDMLEVAAMGALGFVASTDGWAGPIRIESGAGKSKTVAILGAGIGGADHGL
jgi:hypothetical protein